MFFFRYFFCLCLQVFIGRDFGQGFVAKNLRFGLRWESCSWIHVVDEAEKVGGA